jgi:hypothetical protein
MLPKSPFRDCQREAYHKTLEASAPSSVTAECSWHFQSG